MLPKVITFDPTFGILICLALWKLDIQSNPRIPRSPQSESGKTSKCAFKFGTRKCNKTNFSMSWWHQPDALCWAAGSTQWPLKVRRALESVPRAINSPWHPRLDQNWKIGFLGVVWAFVLGIFPPFPTNFSTKIYTKNTSKFLDSSLFTKNTKYCSYP